MSVWISFLVLQFITGMASSMGFLYDSTDGSVITVLCF